MSRRLLLCCVLLCVCCVTLHTHMIMEKQQNSNQTITEHVSNQTHTPAVLIIGLSKTPKRNKSEMKPKKSKYSSRVKKPPPPPNCVSLWGSCKPPSAVCCEHCAFCHCRLFKTVCYCRMGNPRC